MKISSYNQNNKSTYNKNNVSFKAINIIQMPQKAFSELTDYEKINNIFDEVLKKHITTKPNGFLQKLSQKLGITFNMPKTWLEYPSYLHSKVELAKYDMSYSMNWLRENTRLPIKNAIKDGYYTFFVFSGEDSKSIGKGIMQVIRSIRPNLSEASSKYPINKTMRKIYAMVKCGVQLDEKIIEAITKNKPTVHKLATLEELDKFAQELQ